MGVESSVISLRVTARTKRVSVSECPKKNKIPKIRDEKQKNKHDGSENPNP